MELQGCIQKFVSPCGRELYHLQFSLQAVSLETFWYTLIHSLLYLAIL